MQSITEKEKKIIISSGQGVNNQDLLRIAEFKQQENKTANQQMD